MHPLRLALSCFLLGFCSLSYEFMLAQLISLLEGHTVFYYGMTIGIYVFGLGVGSLAATNEEDVQLCLARLVNIEIKLATLGACSPLILASLQSYPLSQKFSLIPGILLIFSIAWLSGRELPWLLRIAEIQGQKLWLTRLVGIDYLASFIGALAFPLWIFPQFGIVAAGLSLGLFNLFAAFLLLDRQTDRNLLGKLSMAIAIGLLLWYNADCLENILSQGLLRS